MHSDTTLEIIRGLANPIRLSIVRKLALDDQPVPSTQLVRTCAHALELSQPTMSHHFTRMVRCGILYETKVKTVKHYGLNKKTLTDIGINVDRL